MGLSDFGFRHWGASLLLGGVLYAGSAAVMIAAAREFPNPVSSTVPMKTSTLQEYDALSAAKSAVAPYRDILPEQRLAVETLESRIALISASPRYQTELARYDAAADTSADAQETIRSARDIVLYGGAMTLFFGMYPLMVGIAGFRHETKRREPSTKATA